MEALRALAQHYDECLFCGILDAKREEELLGDALSLYQECLVRDPGDFAARLAAGRLLLRTKRYREAAGQLSDLADPHAGNPQATLWYMESLFRLGQFEEIHRLARFWASQPQSGDYPPESLDAVRLWAGDSQEDESLIPLRGL
ncbi:MAG: tetratricopeptide repeat protein [Acidobacteriia bacterium]|nr:tetratricopeptide repeat protein [Terriglobia bacterium]